MTASSLSKLKSSVTAHILFSKFFRASATSAGATLAVAKSAVVIASVLY